MLSCNIGGHAAYQDFILTKIFHFYPDPFAFSKDIWKIIIEFWNLDLSLTDSLMVERYSKQEPAPRLPFCMLRSYLLSIKFKLTSITRGAALLEENSWYAIFSGFSFDNVPGIATFMIFLSAHAFSFIFQLYQTQFLHKSVEMGLINPAKFSLAGDGTPVKTSSLLRKNESASARNMAIQFSIYIGIRFI